MSRLAGKRSSGIISRPVLAVLACLYLAQSAPAACPSADLNGDCFIDLRDFALLAAEWPTSDFTDITLMVADWLAPDPCVADDMVFIPGGTFEMGDSFAEGDAYELPVHTVTVDSFYMGKYEVTNEEYCDYLNSALSEGLITVTDGVVYQAGSGTSCPYCDTSTRSPYSQIACSSSIFSVRSKGGRIMSDDPMVMVNWYGAAAYCNWRNRQEGYEECYDLSTWACHFSMKGYRLPTEAEWEYAGRGALAGNRFALGDTISHSQVNYYSWSSYPYDISPTRGYHPTWDDGYPYTSPVGSFVPNGYGLYDMAGNVWEWCNDWCGVYSATAQTDPTGPTTGEYRVLRGGGWGSLAYYCRVAYRDADGSPGPRPYYVGFRVVLSD